MLSGLNYLKTRPPEEFVYDDRHLILALLSEPGRDDSQIDNLSFELQIKTEMQAAVAAISRPLTYKTRWLSWSRARLASRIRATVELVDDLLSRLSEIPADTAHTPEERYEDYVRLNSIIDLLERTLASEQLPEDRRRLALTVDAYLKDCKPKQQIATLRHC